jgi:hypothetical protein
VVDVNLDKQQENKPSPINIKKSKKNRFV